MEKSFKVLGKSIFDKFKTRNIKIIYIKIRNKYHIYVKEKYYKIPFDKHKKNKNIIAM